MADLYLNKITWNVVENDKKQQGTKITENGTSYTVFDTNGDGKISADEVSKQLGKNLDGMKDKTLGLFQKIQDKKIEDIEKILSGENTGSSSVEGELARRKNRQKTERAIRSNLLKQRNLIAQQQNAFNEYRNLAQYRGQMSRMSQMMNPMFGGMNFMNPMFGGLGFNPMFGNMGFNPMFGGGLFNSMFGGFGMNPLFNLGQMFGSGFGLFNRGGQGINAQDQAELNAFANMINTNVDNLREKLTQYGITEQELYEGKGKLSFDVTHEYSISREETPQTPHTPKPAQKPPVDPPDAGNKQQPVTPSATDNKKTDAPAAAAQQQPVAQAPTTKNYPAPDPEAAKVPSDSYTRLYYASEGDTLESIAEKENIPLDKLQKLNSQYKNGNIPAGTMLLLSRRIVDRNANSIGYETDTNLTLEQIAKMKNIPLDILMAYNPDIAENEILPAHTLLQVPGDGAQSKSPEKPAAQSADQANNGKNSQQAGQNANTNAAAAQQQPVTPSATDNKKSQYEEYTIEDGDNLINIIKKKYPSIANNQDKIDALVEEIAKLNNIDNPNLIQIGETLRLPKKQGQKQKN